MSDSESDIEIKSAMTKKHVKIPVSPSDHVINNNSKKITTKLMIVDALTELKNRKGVSLHAIKKHLTEKYRVDTQRINFMIKKTIKSGVDDGSIIQLKGNGASGSFKLAPKKEKPKKQKKKLKPEKSEKEKKTEKVKKPKVTEKEEEKPKIKKKEKKEESKLSKKNIEIKPKKSKSIEKKGTKSKVKMAKETQTPAKKRAAMMKRKSIGSIIKPPKMKPAK